LDAKITGLLLKLESATAVDFSPDDTKIVSYDKYDEKIKIWTTNNDTKIKEITTKNIDYESPIKFSSDQTKIASIQ